MARLATLGFERNSVTAGVEFTGSSATAPVIQTTITRGGLRALQIPSLVSGTPKFLSYEFLTTPNTTTDYYLRVAFYVATLPTAEHCIIQLGTTSAAVSITNPGITIDQTGVFRLKSSSTSTVGSPSSAVTTGAWNYLEIHHKGGVGSAILAARLNGTQFATNSAGNIATVVLFFVGGNLYGEAQTTGIWYFDDIALNDSTGTTQTTFPGDGYVIELRPNAAGDNNAFATQVGGTAGSANNFTRVKEIPPDAGTTFNGSPTVSTIDDFNVDDTPTLLNSTSTINVVEVGNSYAGSSAATVAAAQVRLKKTSGGTVATGTAVTPNSTSYQTNQNAVPRISPLITYLDPDGAAWTKATLDTAQVGYIISTGNTNQYRVSNVWMVVDYLPGAAPATSSSSTMLMMGVG